MNVTDIHAHIYERVAGITREQPMLSTGLGRVAIGSEEVQFLLPSFEQSYSIAEMSIVYMDRCDIEKAILIPNPYHGYHNRYFADSTQRYPSRSRGVTSVDIMKGQEAVRELAFTYDRGILFGFKVEVDSTFQCVPETRPTDSRPVPAWDRCSQYHQSVFIRMLRTEDIEGMGVPALTHPNTCLALCHIGADVRFKKGMPESNYRQVLDLVKNRPNISIDTPTVPVYLDKRYPQSSSVGITQARCRHVGPGKTMQASDYPGILNHGTMRQLTNLVEEHCSHIPGSHRQMIMADNARRSFFDNQR